MCKKFVLASKLERIERRFNVRFGRNSLVIPQSFSIESGSSSYVITTENPHELQVFNFGMTPSFSKAPLNIINARAEGDKNLNNDPEYNGSNAIFLKSAFKKPIQLQRCIIIADAYYEWSIQNKPYLVFLQNKDRPFGFAGVYDSWKNPETNEIHTGFAIITTTANSMLQKIGVKRMPVILPFTNGTDWVKPSKPLSYVLSKLIPYPSEKMNAYPVSEKVNIQGIDDPTLVNPVGAKLQAEYLPSRIERRHYSRKDLLGQHIPWFEKNE